MDNASEDRTAERVEAVGDGRARAPAPQRAQPRQGLLDAPRHARGARRAAPALRRRLRELTALAAADARADRGRRRGRGSRLAEARRSATASRCAGGSSGRSFQQLCRLVLREPTSDLFCGFKLWRARPRSMRIRAPASRAGPSTPRCSRWRAPSATGSARPASCGRTARARASDGAHPRAGGARAVRRAAPRAPGSAAPGDPPPAELAAPPESAVRACTKGPAAPPYHRRAHGSGRIAAPRPVRGRGARRSVALAFAPLAGLLRARLDEGRRGERRRRLPRRRSAPVPDLAARGGRPRGGREPLRPATGRTRSSTPACWSRACSTAPGWAWWPLHGVEAGGVLALFAGALAARAALPRGPTTGGSRSCSRCSSPHRLPRSSAGPASAANAKFDFDFVSGELWPGTYLWGYLFTALAVGLVPLGLLAYERGRLRRRRAAGVCGRLRPLRVAAALAGGDLRRWCSWAPSCSPAARARRPLARGARPRPAGRRHAAPLVYYYVLSRTDASWELGGRGERLPALAVVGTVLGLLPLALPAAFAYRLPAPDFGSLALRVWPLAGLAIFYQPGGTFPFHAFRACRCRCRCWPCSRSATGSANVPCRSARGRGGARSLRRGHAYRANELREAVNLGRQPFFLDGRARRAPPPGAAP